MSNLKIGFVIDDGLDRLDGVQQYVLSLGRWLERQGNEVHYLAGETRRSDIKNVHSMSRNLRVKFNANMLSSPLPASKKKIIKILEKEKFDILHVQVPYSPFMAGRVISLGHANCKIVGTFHILPFGWFHKQAAKLLGIWLHYNFRKIDQMLAVSPPAAEFCREIFGLKPEVLPNCVDIESFHSKPPKNKDFTIVFMGRLVERKGCMQLIKAVNHILEEGLTKKPFRVVIGGDGPNKGRIKSQIKRYELEKVISHEGYINESSKPEFLARADIAVFPSLGGESFGIVLIEAMAAGAGVVLGGDNPGYRSVMGSIPNSLTDAKSHINLAKSLADLLNEDELRHNIHAEQQKLVKKYDVNAVGGSLLKIYEDLVK